MTAPVNQCKQVSLIILWLLPGTGCRVWILWVHQPSLWQQSMMQASH